MTPDELGQALRHDTSPFLRKRRAISMLSLVSIASMGTIALYQLGVSRYVLEPALPGANGDKINGSAQAYELLETPDAILAIGSYSVTLALAALGGPDRANYRAWAPLSMGAKAALDCLIAIRLLFVQKNKFRAYSVWSVVAAIATIAILPLALPEAIAGYSNLVNRDNTRKTKKND